MRLPLRTALEMAGHIVREASDGAAGLLQLRKLPADLVITDLRMPGLAGDELLRRLKADFPDAKVIAVSAADVELAEGLEVDCVVQKPFELRQVVERVADLLSGRHA